MDELFASRGQIVLKERWDARIDAIRESVDREQEKQEKSAEQSIEERKQSWLRAFERAILDRVAACDGAPIGVFLSGGVDSTFIAFLLQKHNVPFTCYTAGFKDPGTKEPDDVLDARVAAKRYGWSHKELVLDLSELRVVVDETIRALGSLANPVSVGIGAVIIAAAQLAKKDGVTVFFGGLGSEEIFAGYRRHEAAHKKEGLSEECWHGLHNMYDRDLTRDTALATTLHITVWTPFLDAEIIKLTMLIPDEEKIKGNDKKHILRAIAVDAGLDREFAFRPKRAAQYGSRINKGLLRLAWQKGLSKKGDYLTAASSTTTFSTAVPAPAPSRNHAPR